jgi:hypothetical protein
MPALAALKASIGKWQGTNQLWLAPGQPVRSSKSTAEIRAIAQDQFSEIRYTWADEGKAQEGKLVLSLAPDSGSVKAVWFDTWHMANAFMVCDGAVDERGVVRVRGTYAAPPGPDWGWRITIEPNGKDALRFAMHNITPDGDEFLAVEVAYARCK